MSTNLTPRLGLSKPDSNELMSQLDRDWNDPMDTIDSHAGFFECTSGTRPSNPYIGMGILETDTTKILIWNGSAWIVYAIKDCSWDFSGLTSLTPPTGALYTLANWSNQSIFNATWGASGLVINSPGVYMVSLNIRWAARNQNTLGFFRSCLIDQVAHDSSTVIRTRNFVSSSNSTIANFDRTYMQAGGIFVCENAGQKIVPRAMQNSGGAYNLESLDSHFTGVSLAPIDVY